MKINKDKFRLEHIVESIEKIEKIVNVVQSFPIFEEKWIEQDAMIRNFEVIGEASVHISEELKIMYPDIAWNEMKGMRNFITHEYFGLQLDTIWDSALHDIPNLKQQMLLILKEFD